MNLHIQNRESLLACPSCKNPSLVFSETEISCSICGESYGYQFGAPFLVKRNSPVFQWYKPGEESQPSNSAFNGRVASIYWQLRPEARIWTRRSQKALQNLLSTVHASNGTMVLVGAGFESVYQRILKPYKDILRIGLATRGEVDLISDVCDIPLLTDSVDLIFSSSVLEHVYNPEQAVREMFRVLQPGGYVYAEIPFMRAYHMAPVDYQRYTISGIEELFKRHGFQLVEKGICSGPFTALALFLVDFFAGLFSFNKYAKAVASLFLSILLHPIKYFDKLVETSKWSEINACNFYYIGQK